MKNDQTKKQENVRTENEKDAKVTKQKTDRLDRLENDIELVKAGLLVLINYAERAEDSITPIGTHDPDAKTDDYMDLKEAVQDNAPLLSD